MNTQGQSPVENSAPSGPSVRFEEPEATQQPSGSTQGARQATSRPWNPHGSKAGPSRFAGSSLSSSARPNYGGLGGAFFDHDVTRKKELKMRTQMAYEMERKRQEQMKALARGKQNSGDVSYTPAPPAVLLQPSSGHHLLQAKDSKATVTTVAPKKELPAASNAAWTNPSRAIPPTGPLVNPSSIPVNPNVRTTENRQPKQKSSKKSKFGGVLQSFFGKKSKKDEGAVNSDVVEDIHASDQNAGSRVNNVSNMASSSTSQSRPNLMGVIDEDASADSSTRVYGNTSPNQQPKKPPSNRSLEVNSRISPRNTRNPKKNLRNADDSESSTDSNTDSASDSGSGSGSSSGSYSDSGSSDSQLSAEDEKRPTRRQLPLEEPMQRKKVKPYQRSVEVSYSDRPERYERQPYPRRYPDRYKNQDDRPYDFYSSENIYEPHRPRYYYPPRGPCADNREYRDGYVSPAYYPDSYHDDRDYKDYYAASRPGPEYYYSESQNYCGYDYSQPAGYSGGFYHDSPSGHGGVAYDGGSPQREDIYVDEVMPAPYAEHSPRWGREGAMARRAGPSGYENFQ